MQCGFCTKHKNMQAHKWETEGEHNKQIIVTNKKTWPIIRQVECIVQYLVGTENNIMTLMSIYTIMNLSIIVNTDPLVCTLIYLSFLFFFDFFFLSFLRSGLAELTEQQDDCEVDYQVLSKTFKPLDTHSSRFFFFFLFRLPSVVFMPSPPFFLSPSPSARSSSSSASSAPRSFDGVRTSA